MVFLMKDTWSNRGDKFSGAFMHLNDWYDQLECLQQFANEAQATLFDHINKGPKSTYKIIFHILISDLRDCNMRELEEAVHGRLDLHLHWSRPHLGQPIQGLILINFHLYWELGLCSYLHIPSFQRCLFINRRRKKLHFPIIWPKPNLKIFQP